MTTTVLHWWWTQILHIHTFVLHNFKGPLFLMTKFQSRSEQDTSQSLCLQSAFGPQLMLTPPLSTINSKSLLPLAMQFSMLPGGVVQTPLLAGSEFWAIILLLGGARCTCSLAVPVGQGVTSGSPVEHPGFTHVVSICHRGKAAPPPLVDQVLLPLPKRQLLQGHHSK